LLNYYLGNLECLNSYIIRCRSDEIVRVLYPRKLRLHHLGLAQKALETAAAVERIRESAVALRPA
jgi:hypothetical protein